MGTLSHPCLLGFEEMERLVERLAKSGADAYPPYNIERLRREPDGERLRITLAVAGFSREELEVRLEENQLVIRGRQGEEDGRSFLHRGIAARQFQRVFVLAEGMDVTGAALADGLLSIDLLRPEPPRRERTIEIVG
jgi:HSP20 family molecular chaperone IbpA